MKLWLDDLRSPPDESWTWVRTVAEAIMLMETGHVTEASLDHDLGQDGDGNLLPEGRRLIVWMEERGCWPSEAIEIHSANVVGVEYMLSALAREPSFVRVGHTQRFVRSDP